VHCDAIGNLNNLDSRVKFTGIVITYNEGARLRECLQSLSFCEQLIVVDLGSFDDSVEIAKKCGVELILHEWAPVVEKIWPDVISLARNNWILRADPDEVFPAPLIKDLENVIANDHVTALVSLPHQYYFRGIPLKTTVWGRTTYIHKVFHKDRIILTSLVHRGLLAKDGYNEKRVEAKIDNLILHYWIDTYYQLFAKHWRYIRQEGKAKYDFGERFWWRRWIRNTWQALRQNLIDYDGLKGGFVGIFLSFFYAWYVNMSLLSLWHYQKKVKKSHALPPSG
jgi:glycosyltransferase involved in cell wall biosynthesis